MCFRSGEFQAAAPGRGTLLTLCNLQIWMFSMASSEPPLHHGRGLLSGSQSGLQSAHPPAWNLHSLPSAKEGSECSSDPYCPESIAPGLERTGHSPEPRTPRVPAFHWPHNTFMLTSEGGLRASHNMCKNHKTVYNYLVLKSAGQGYPRHLWLIANRRDLSVPLETIQRNTNHDLWLLFVRHDFSFFEAHIPLNYLCPFKTGHLKSNSLASQGKWQKAPLQQFFPPFLFKILFQNTVSFSFISLAESFSLKKKKIYPAFAVLKSQVS